MVIRKAIRPDTAVVASLTTHGVKGGDQMDIEASQDLAEAHGMGALDKKEFSTLIDQAGKLIPGSEVGGWFSSTKLASNFINSFRSNSSFNKLDRLYGPAYEDTLKKYAAYLAYKANVKKVTQPYVDTAAQNMLGNFSVNGNVRIPGLENQIQFGHHWQLIKHRPLDLPSKHHDYPKSIPHD